MADTAENKIVQDLAVVSTDAKFVVEDGRPYFIIPEGYQIQDIEDALPVPIRKRGKTVMSDAVSFIKFFNLHKTDSSHIYATVNPSKFVGVINDNSADKTGWGDFVVQYSCPYSNEWEEWIEFNKRQVDQVAFAEFIEIHVPDIVSSAPNEPSGAEMLQVATSFKANVKVNFASAQRLDNGQVDFAYQEEISGSAGAKGQIKVPERFFIGIRVFEGGEPYKVEAKLRYRLKDGRLTMGFDLVRPRIVVESTTLDIWKQIKEGTGTDIWRGIH